MLNDDNTAPPAFDEIPATQLAIGLREGRWTSVELTKHFLGRIAAVNPRVHAVVSTEAHEALAQAAESDRRRAARNPLGPLDGIPMTVKDAFRVRGHRSTYGLWMFRNYRPRTDSQVIAALRSRGVVVMGRTAVPTGSFDWNCRNRIHAECVNPLDASRTPGGSSGGAAAALALGLTPLEIGSDYHGSLRYPAHCCGIYSLRTTDGWLPIEDIGPEPLPPTFRRIVACGPMARNLADLDLMLATLAEAFPLPEAPHSPDSTRKLKIAFSKEILGIHPDNDTRRLLDERLAKLAHQGHELCETSPNFDWDDLYRDFGMIGGHEFVSVLPRLLRTRFTAMAYARLALQSRLGTGPFLDYFRKGMLAGKSEYESALQRRERIFPEVDEFFSAYDVWMLPIAPSAAIPRNLCGKKIPTDHGEIEYLRYLGSYLGPTAMLGTPALALPIGRDPKGLPIGVQIHGARFSDRQLVRAAQSAFSGEIPPRTSP